MLIGDLIAREFSDSERVLINRDLHNSSVRELDKA